MNLEHEPFSCWYNENNNDNKQVGYYFILLSLQILIH